MCQLFVTIIARDMQNLRQIMHISPKTEHNLTRSFAMDNHRSQLLRCGFYLRIVKVVIVAERIHVNESKNHFQRNVTPGHSCQFKFHSASHDVSAIRKSTRVGVSICKQVCHPFTPLIRDVFLWIHMDQLMHSD